MKHAEIRRIVFEELSSIAPEADPSALAGTADFREALDIDSMDFLNFVAALHKRTGIDIPEADYPKLFTLDGATEYLGKVPDSSR